MRNPQTAHQHWSLRLLKWFCPPHLLEEIEGDLIQKFEKDVKTFGERKAKRRLLWNVIRFFRSGIIGRGKILKPLNTMLINNLQFSLRHLGRQKINSFIHVLGLALGIGACLLIAIFIHHEKSFDEHHPNADNIFRVNSVLKESEKQFNLYATPLLLAEALRHEVPQIRHVAKVLPQFKSVVSLNDGRNFKQEHILIAEPEFLDIFSVNILEGNGRLALKNPYSAIISTSIARKFFGDESPVGKSFRFRNNFDITVAAVMQDLPTQTSLPASILLSYTENEKFLNNGDTWYFGGFAWAKLQACTFVLLEDGSSEKTNDYLTTIANKNINASAELDKTIHGSFELQPLKDIHFDTTRFGGGPWVSSIDNMWLWLFGVIGVVILTLACINFLNLSVAQSITRVKEASMRKVMGASRTQLIIQFLTEPLLLILMAGMVAIVLAVLLLPSVNTWLNKNFSFQLLQTPLVWFAFFGGLIFLGILTGLYPSLVMARFDPTKLLKSKSMSHASRLQQSLVVTQFATSATLIVVVLLIARQVNFVKSKDLGLEKENILQIPFDNKKGVDAFANSLRQMAGVSEVSLSRSAPISNDHWWNTIGKEESSERQSVCAIYGDEFFYKVYGLRLLAGQIPSSTKRKDTLVSHVVVNEKLVKALNLGEVNDAVGKRFWWGGPTEIVGVVANFNVEPLHFDVSPTLIVQDSTVYSQCNVRLSSSQSTEIMRTVQESYKNHFPDGVYESVLLTDQINSFYKTESKLFSLLMVFTIVAVIISCMGLWGIASFVTLRRTKEMSIRKIVGARVTDILSLLIRQFLKPIVMAQLIALPVSWYLINLILSNYAYRTEVSIDLLFIPFLILISIALITISSQTIKTALVNPANNLRSE